MRSLARATLVRKRLSCGEKLVPSFRLHCRLLLAGECWITCVRYHGFHNSYMTADLFCSRNPKWWLDKPKEHLALGRPKYACNVGCYAMICDSERAGCDGNRTGEGDADCLLSTAENSTNFDRKLPLSGRTLCIRS